MQVLEGKMFDFGKFRLDIANRVLRHDDEIVSLPLKSVELLCLLVENRGEVVTKQKIFESVWQDSFVEDSVLTQNIYQLRKTFEGFGEKDLIKTVPRRGYIFKLENGHHTSHTIERKIYEEIEITETEASPEEPVLALASTRIQNYRNLRPVLAASVVVLALTLSVIGMWRYARGPQNPTFPEIKSIAILSFTSLSNDDDERALALGIKEKLLMNLGGLRDLKVKNLDVDENQLDNFTDIDAFLLGNVQSADGKIRVNLRFLRASDKQQLWSASFDEDHTEVFKLQDLISTKITDSLALSLTRPEKENIFKRYTESAEAYELYLKGRYYWNKRNFGEEAETYFRRAIEKDPKFALAYVGLADELLITGEKDADFYLTKALEIEPNLAEAYASRGFLNTFNRWNWEQAESDFKRSIELNPVYGRAYQWYATLLMIRGRHPEAIAKLQRAIEIEPQSFNFYSDLGEAYYFARDYETAEKFCRKALEINPEFVFAHQNLTKIYLEKGEYEKWARASQLTWFYVRPPEAQTTETKKGFENTASEIIKIYQKSGIQAVWRTQMEDSKPVENTPNYFTDWAYLHNRVGDKESALDNLEKAVERREFLTPFINVEPYYDELRTEPRFQEILRKMNLRQ